MRSTCFILLLFVVLLSCSKEDWTETVKVPLSSNSNFDEGAALSNHALRADSALIYITSIHVQGERLQGEDVEIVTTENIAVNLLDNANIDILEIPKGTYESLTISFSCTTNGYLDGTVENVNGNPNTQLISIPLDFQDKKLELAVFDNEEGDVFTIGDGGKSLMLEFNLQKTLTGVGVGPWNGMINASQSQSNVDINTVVGQNFLISFKEQLFENAILKIE